MQVEYHLIAKLTGRQIRAARGLVGWTAVDLAAASQVGVATIRRSEVDNGPVRMTSANAASLQRAFEDAGVEFIAENGGGAGVRMKEAKT